MQQTDHTLRIGIIGGTGLGDMLLAGMAPDDMQEHRIDSPFGTPSSTIITGTYSGTPIAFLKRHGEGHVHNPAQVPYRANVFALKALGCTHVLASGATGSLREDIAPGDVVLCDQLIDRTDGRPRTFYDHAAVHVEFADPMCPVMRRWLIEAAQNIDGTRVHHAGTYICMEGPSFSTRAESEMHRAWGADVVGMTALPEARLIREAEMAYALIALPTDYDCWRPRKVESTAESSLATVSLLQEIIGNLQAATAASIQLIEAALRDVSVLEAQGSPAHEALGLAIWSDKKSIDAAEVQRLHVLWGRHFEG